MKGFAEYYILKNDLGASEGYGIRIFKTGECEPIEEYTAGDSALDSQIYGTGDLSVSTLRKFAKDTAKEMMKELSLVGSVQECDE